LIKKIVTKKIVDFDIIFSWLKSKNSIILITKNKEEKNQEVKSLDFLFG
jgi:hypothetical protein